MNYLNALMIVSLTAAVFAIAAIGFSQQTAPSHTLTMKKVIQSVSGESEEIVWEISTGVEPGREFHSKASIGGSGIALRGTVEAASNGKFKVAVNISESIARPSIPGPDGQPLKVTDEREIQINLLIAPGEELTAARTRSDSNVKTESMVEAVFIRLDQPSSAKPAAPAGNVEILNYEWKPNEEAPRKSGLRLLPGQKPPQYLIAFRTEKLESAQTNPLEMAPKVIVAGDDQGRIQIQGPKETISFDARVQNDEGGVLEFRTTLTRELIDESAAPESEASSAAKSKKISEKVEREMTLKPGEEKEVGEFMGVKVLVTVTRVE